MIIVIILFKIFYSFSFCVALDKYPVACSLSYFFQSKWILLYDLCLSLFYFWFFMYLCLICMRFSWKIEIFFFCSVQLKCTRNCCCAFFYSSLKKIMESKPKDVSHTHNTHRSQVSSFQQYFSYNLRFVVNCRWSHSFIGTSK